jgi:RNA polymerase sporulation-specific sigma factor
MGESLHEQCLARHMQRRVHNSAFSLTGGWCYVSLAPVDKDQLELEGLGVRRSGRRAPGFWVIGIGAAPGEVARYDFIQGCCLCSARKGSSVARLSSYSQSQPKVEDGFLIALAKQGHPEAYDQIVRRYYGFVRLKASSYFLAGGDADDLIQEGLVGLYKAVRDYRTDRESSFRNFAELCITRQIITAVKTATRNKHTPLNQYVSFSSSPAGGTGDNEPTLDEMLPGSTVHDPVNQVISSEELRALVACISTALSELESRVLGLYLDGHSYEEVGHRLGCDCKTVDNALQRVKRKVGAHLSDRAIAA